LNKENFIEISGGTDPVKLGQPAKTQRWQNRSIW